MTPPIAKRIPEKLEKHGHLRLDPYYWMNQRENPEVIEYIEAENAYTQAKLAPTQDLQETLFAEMKARIKEEDSSVPYHLDGYYYYHRFEPGKEYPVYARKQGSLDNEEEITLDVNTLAEGEEFCIVRGGDRVSPNHRFLAYAIDTMGRRIYDIRIKDLRTGETFEDEIKGVTGNAVWAADNRTLFYTRQDEESLRSSMVFRHVIGTDSELDELVYEEKDETYYTYVYAPQSRAYVMIAAASTMATEVWYLDAQEPEKAFTLFNPREKVHEYLVDHLGENFYIRTNWDAKNFRLMRASLEQTQKGGWTEVIPHREDVLLENMELFEQYLVLEERESGLNRLCLVNRETGQSQVMSMEEPVYSVGLSNNPDPQASFVRFRYESLTTPASIIDYDMVSGDRQLQKQTEVLGGFDFRNYTSQRVFASANDGTQIPISLVYHKDTPLDGSAPLLQYGYGSYGYSMDPYFNTNRLSLLNRGFVFALAHVRGGEDMGRHWYEEGKMLKKKNTFTDFIACGEHLIASKFTSHKHMYAMGGSAGGLLVGAAINMQPELFAGAIAAVPFVDVVTTMLDESIPLTTGEYHEWGNPNQKEFYEYMLSYSPYDNIGHQEYPHLLVTSGLHDSQVQYWEPTKWVAKLRHEKKGDHLILLHTNMGAGHSGASGRFEMLKEVAMEYAFLLMLEQNA